jgi:hexulose-6-phosphate isomerase
MMQGRLSPLIENRIQTFPAGVWEEEIKLCRELGIRYIEWTIDTLTLSQNPIIQIGGTERINSILAKHKTRIPSVTCDYYMENPHWESKENDISETLRKLIESMSKIGARVLVLPLVDSASISKNPNMDLSFFHSMESLLLRNRVIVAFETDLDPIESREFIDNFNPHVFGINYDIGNSASLGFSPNDEFLNYGNRILNVHVKDRIFGGHTVPLGEGNADFQSVVKQLKKFNYSGNYILQTARSTSGNHTEELIKNIHFFERALIEY